LEAEAIEEDAPDGARAEAPSALLVPRDGGDVSVWRDEARTVAIAAAGGIVAGAATVAVAKAAARVATPAKRSRKGGLRRRDDREVLASRSFLVDVHLLGR
jgi:hypothetical protein